MNPMGCKIQNQFDRIGVLDKWTKPRSACTEGNHAHGDNILADIDTTHPAKTESPVSQINGWLLLTNINGLTTHSIYFDRQKTKIYDLSKS